MSEVACWAHFRRELFERHKQQPTALTTDLLNRIGQLYAIEADIRGQPAEVRRTTRQARSRPLVTALRVALDDALRKLAPKSLMTKAIRYGTKRWDAFTRFLDDGRLEIDNNIAERAIRPIAIGRKNWLFAGSEAGGTRAAAIYSVIETAKMNGLEPQAYITDVIDASHIGTHANRRRFRSGGDGLPWSLSSRENAEYLGLLNNAAFGAATELVPSRVSPSDPAARYTSAHGGQAQFCYVTNCLINIENTVIVNVEASTAV